MLRPAKDSVALRDESFVLYAVVVSIVLHGLIFAAWPNLQQARQAILIASGELIPPQPPTPAPEPDIQPPTEEKEPEIAAPRPREPSPVRERQVASRPDTGVALPVLAEKSSGSEAAGEYVVPDLPPLREEDALPFGSRVGTVSINDYVPSPAPPTPATSDSDLDENEHLEPTLLSDFGNVLRDLSARYGEYPEIAAKRRWQGVARILVRFNADGSPRQISVKESSGRKILDDKAIEMVQQAVSVAELPAELKGKRFSITVPIKFRLQ